MWRYICGLLFESCDGLYSCVESSSNMFNSNVESFFSGFRVGYICDLVDNSRSVGKVVSVVCTISSSGCILADLMAVPRFCSL